jgi:hypothetical protein
MTNPTARLNRRAFVSAVAATCIASVDTRAAPIPRASEVPDWKPILDWLPEDTETLVVAPSGIELAAPKGEAAPENLELADVLHWLPLGPLGSVCDGFLQKQLAGLKVLCAVEGSRRFTRPAEFGLMPYEGCHVLRFATEADATLKKVMRACQEKAKRAVELNNVTIAVFPADDEWTYFVCRPCPGVLMLATNRAYLEETLKRIDKKPARRALPTELLEWKHVDVAARVWAVRHYSKEFAKNDPSSPLCPGGDDPDAIGTTLWTNDKTGDAEIRYLSRSKDALDIARAAWGAEKAKVAARKAAPEVIELVLATKGQEAAAYGWFAITARLGHVVVS